jgi:hypothetical protein
VEDLVARVGKAQPKETAEILREAGHSFCPIFDIRMIIIHLMVDYHTIALFAFRPPRLLRSCNLVASFTRESGVS